MLIAVFLGGTVAFISKELSITFRIVSFLFSFSFYYIKYTNKIAHSLR